MKVKREDKSANSRGEGHREGLLTLLFSFIYGTQKFAESSCSLVFVFWFLPSPSQISRSHCLHPTTQYVTVPSFSKEFMKQIR